MKNKIVQILFVLAALLSCASISFAAVQVVNGAGNQAIDVNGIADGVSMTGQAATESTLTVADNENVNTNNNAAGIATNATGRGNVTFNGTSNVKGTLGTAGSALNTISAGVATETVTFEGDIVATTVNYAGDGAISLGNNGDITAAITTSTTNTGTLTLAGSSTITGQTGTSSAVLKQITVGASGSTSTFTSAVFASNLDFSSDGDAILQGNATIASGIDFLGDGTLTLDAGASLTGDIRTATNGTGTFKVIGGSSTSGGAIGSGNDLLAVQVGQDGILTLANSVEAQTVTIYHAGTVVLSGDRTITGDVELVDTDLGGTGFAGLTVGTNALTITGALDLAASTTLNLTANSSSVFGSVAVGGNAGFDVASTINVTVGGYIPSGTTLAVVTSGAGATNPIVTDNSAILTFTPSTSSGDTTLTVTRNSVATTGNAASVGSTLNQLGVITSDMTTVMGAIDNLSTASQAESALDQLDPTANGGGAQTSFAAGSLHLDTVSSHLVDARDGVYSGGQTGISSGDTWHEQGMWFKGFGGHADQDRRGGINGFKSDIWGASFGMDGLVTEDVRLGFAGGYSASSVENQGETGGTDISTYQATVYTGFGTRPWYLNTAFSFGWHSYSGIRNISFSTINRSAEADYEGQQYSVFLDGGYIIPAQGWEITPLMSLEYSRLNVGGYSESGAGALNLTVADQSYDLLQMGLGIKLAYPILTEGGSWVPEMHARWLYDFIGDAFQTSSTFAGGGSSFGTNGPDPAQHALNAGVGITFYSKGNLSLSAIYDLILKEGFLSHNGEAILRYNY